MNDVRNVKDVERIHRVRWADLVELEPELDRLLTCATEAGTDCRNQRDVELRWSPFKGWLAELIGFYGRHRHHPVLGTVAAYDVAYWRLHNAVAGGVRGS